jgi:hypothetical protein
MMEMTYLDQEQKGIQVLISILDNGRFCSSWGRFDLFERSNERWMSLAPFLVVLLMELATSPGWVSRSVRSLHRNEPRPVSKNLSVSEGLVKI